MEPIPVTRRDILVYEGDGKFLIVNPARWPDRKLPEKDMFPYPIPAQIQNNQRITFGCIGSEPATLHDINGLWYFKPCQPKSKPYPLPLFVSFEIAE